LKERENVSKIFYLLIAIFSLTVTAALAQDAAPTQNQDPEAAKIITSDIELFWKAYDAAKPENNLYVFRDEYLRKGSVGLQEFRRLRIGTSCNLVEAIDKAPKYYAALRAPSLKIASYENQMRASFRKMKEIYPAAVFPDVYFVVGRMSSAGTLSDKGLLIGIDMFGKNDNAPLDELSDWHKAVVGSTARLPYIVAHELVHYEQKFPKGEEWTLLGKVLSEGGADFIAELTAGDTINPHLHAYGNPREKELWLAFKQEMNGKDAKNWLYQGADVKDKPADLGYYMGYKIIESYYKNAADKKQAVKDILEIKDFNAFLKVSRYEEKFASQTK
jgi:hypothetical protein